MVAPDDGRVSSPGRATCPATVRYRARPPTKVSTRGTGQGAVDRTSPWHADLMREIKDEGNQHVTLYGKPPMPQASSSYTRVSFVRVNRWQTRGHDDEQWIAGENFPTCENGPTTPLNVRIADTRKIRSESMFTFSHSGRASVGIKPVLLNLLYRLRGIR